MNGTVMRDLSDYRNSRVLITGASGFIGSGLCARLRALGAELHAVTRASVPATTTGTRWWKVDLVRSEKVEELIASVQPDFVFHLASAVTGQRDLTAVIPTLNGNLVSAVNVLHAAASCRCRRVVLAGSLEEPDSTTAEAVPASPYAAAKWAASGYARMFHALYNTPVVVARIFMVYGPGQRDLQKLIPYVTLALLRGEQPRLSSGARPVDWIHVDDVVSGLLALGLAPHVEGGRIDLGSGELVTVRQVVETLCRLVGGTPEPLFGALPDRPMEQVRRARVQESCKIGWMPSIALEVGLRDTVEWYREQLKSGALT